MRKKLFPLVLVAILVAAYGTAMQAAYAPFQPATASGIAVYLAAQTVWGWAGGVVYYLLRPVPNVFARYSWLILAYVAITLFISTIQGVSGVLLGTTLGGTVYLRLAVDLVPSLLGFARGLLGSVYDAFLDRRDAPPSGA